MMDTKKYLVPAGFAVLLFIAAVGAAWQIPVGDGSKASQPRVEQVTSNEPTAKASASSIEIVSNRVTAPVLTIAPLPADATFVPDEYVLRLSGMVNLANARYERPDKAQWNQAISIAQNLLTGPCDCAQRNWLNHFVEMGSYALSNSESEYQESAKLMVDLGRNDKHAMEISHRMN